MKNKKAQQLFGEHVVELVIAVMSIVILIIIGVAVYDFFRADKDKLAQATADLNLLMQAVQGLVEENDSNEILLSNPKGWAINFQDSIQKRPASCGGNKCLCICKYDSDKDELFANCDSEKTGVCTITNKDIKVIKYDIVYNPEEYFGNIEIQGLTTINLTLSGGTIKIRKK